MCDHAFLIYFYLHGSVPNVGYFFSFLSSYFGKFLLHKPHIISFLPPKWALFLTLFYNNQLHCFSFFLTLAHFSVVSLILLISVFIVSVTSI